MSLVVAAAHFLTFVIAGVYLIGAGWMMSAWLFLYREPDRGWLQPFAVLIWPVPVLALLVRWAFTGKAWTEP